MSIIIKFILYLLIFNNSVKAKDSKRPLNEIKANLSSESLNDNNVVQVVKEANQNLSKLIDYAKTQQKLVENCEISLRKCTLRMTCGLALHDYRISCKQELHGKTNSSCSELCQFATISLANTVQGYDYLNCDCADNTYCKLIKERTKSCHPELDLKNKLCRVSELNCKADSTCIEAWNYYRYLCEQTFNGKECTKRCNSSAIILMSHRKGVNIKECDCDGDYNYYKRCTTEKNNILRLCHGIDMEKIETTSHLFAEPIYVVSNDNPINVRSFIGIFLILLIFVIIVAKHIIY